MTTSTKRIRLATFCTAQEVEKSADCKGFYHNKATKSIFLDLLKQSWTTGTPTIKIPLDEFAHVVWMTYLLRTPTNKGNVKRDKKGNRVVDNESKRCIHNTHPSHFVSLSDNEKETRCMHVIKHLRKYFKIVDGKTEWTVTHPNFATASSLNEEVIENILPNRNAPAIKSSPSPRSCSTRAKRKRSDSEDEDESSATIVNQKRRRRNSDSDVASSSDSSSVVSSPDTSFYQSPDSPSEIEQDQSPVIIDTFGGDFHYGQFNTLPQQPIDLSWYFMMANPSAYYYPVYFPALSAWE